MKTDNTGWCWGDNDYGQLGDGTLDYRAWPAQVPGSWAEIGAGADHTCGRRTDGSTWCWGSNRGGQLGLGDPWTPVAVIDPQ